MATFDYLKTIVSQYANSPIILQLIQNFDVYVDPTANINAFYNLLWRVDTAQGYGLDVWGRIVGVTRALQVAQGRWLGFKESTTVNSDPFNQSPFFFGATLTNNFLLSDTAFRLLIFAKALANISDGSIPSINHLLMSLFPNRGNAYVGDGLFGKHLGFSAMGTTDADPFNQSAFYNGSPLQPMTMAYIFEFALTPVEAAIVVQSGVLPRPPGVAVYTVTH